jgi:5'-AMP-activated protein kinase catalytic alpha subunit
LTNRNPQFSKVKLGFHEITRKEVAIKIISKKAIWEEALVETIKREIKILKLFNNPHIIKLYEVIESNADLFMVMEYAKGGDLYDVI